MCTRVVYSGTNGMVATGRSMDWKTEMHSNLWAFPFNSIILDISVRRKKQAAAYRLTHILYEFAIKYNRNF